MEKYSVSYDMNDETVEQKAKWFQSLSLEERMEIFCEFTEFILTVNPQIAEKEDTKPFNGSILIIEKNGTKRIIEPEHEKTKFI